MECTVCKALGAHKVTIVHVCRKEPLPERTAITLSPSLYCFPLSLYSSSTFSGTFYFPQFFYACLKSFVLLFSFTTSPNNPPSHGLCFISFLFCLSVSLGHDVSRRHVTPMRSAQEHLQIPHHINTIISDL